MQHIHLSVATLIKAPRKKTQVPFGPGQEIILGACRA
jgi:hypothetical protein